MITLHVDKPHPAFPNAKPKGWLVMNEGKPTEQPPSATKFLLGLNPTTIYTAQYLERFLKKNNIEYRVA